ncbi:MAG: 4-hydroxy-tetrahydrodipicolinate reductase [Oscillospiraceae bacterium]|jgi:4-hydroxy-tetrahydrodipicolinate reductase|nr:4-hydroxy-tetrahydrodipicolinate reductase [Oscillospiraceae bacterium]
MKKTEVLMLNLALSGCCGKLCRAVAEYIQTQADIRVFCGIDPGHTLPGVTFPFPVFPSFAAVQGAKPEVILDCSHPKALPGLLEYALREHIPAVVATTGYGETEFQLLDQAAKHIPVFYSANMSLGIQLLKELAQKAARVLGESFDIEIVEAHHNQKIDAPSGTAYLLADAVNKALAAPRDYEFNRQAKREVRKKSEIGFHAIRGGTIVGEHSVIFAGFDEVITLTHSAGSKRLFAAGCVAAVRFVLDKPAGRYGMEDLVQLCCE